jgi:hypothetical protein
VKPEFKLLSVLLFFIWSSIRAQALSPTTNDLWDVSNGTIVSRHSDLGYGTAAEDMFGGSSSSVEPEDTLFSDFRPPGGIHFVEWRTASPVALSSIAIFAGGDGEIYQNEREFSRLTILTKSSISSDFDTVVYDLTPAHPYVLQERSSNNALLTNVVFAAPVTGQFFRAEFVHFAAGRGYDGPRIIELDAFGEKVSIAQINEQPKSQKVFGGTDVTFSISASATSELRYQWFHDGTRLIGSTNAFLVINKVSQSDAGRYWVEISNAVGIQTSSTATLGVIIAEISQQPKDVRASEGATVNFEVAANSASEIKYQWFANNSLLPNATNSILTLTNVSIALRGNYYVVLSTQWGSIASARAALTVLTLPRILSQPASQQVDEGSTVSFRLYAVSETPIHYQWYFNGSAMIGETNAILKLETVHTNASGTYYVEAANVAGTVSSFAATLVVRPLPVTAFKPSADDLWDVSNGVVVTGNSDIGFGTSAEDMFGGGHASLEPGTALFSDIPPEGGIHFVEWQTPNPVTVSSLSIFAAGDGEVYLNEREFSRVTIRAKSTPASGYDKVIYELVPEHPYHFQDAASILLTNVILQTPISGQFFRAEFTHYISGRGYDGPRIVELDAFGIPHSVAEITSQPASQTLELGSSATFSVTAISTNSLRYQWLFNGKTILGETNSVLTLANITFASRGLYSVELSDSIATIESTSVTLEVLAPADRIPPVVVITSPTNLSTVPNNHLILSGIVTDNEGLPAAEYAIDGSNPAFLPLLSDGRFSIEVFGLAAGANVLTVRAADREGNSTTNSVVVNFSPSVSVVLNGSGSYQEGSQFTLPVILNVKATVSGATLKFLYDTNILTDAALTWDPSLDGAFKLMNAEHPGEINIAFALAGMTLPEGDRAIAELTFRARSVPRDTETGVNVVFAGVYDSKGDPVIDGLFSKGANAQITLRKIVGDNNGNSRLDIGDASALLRFVTHIDPIELWDISENDLNANNEIDSGDVIKILRAVVGLDPEPDPGKGRLTAKVMTSKADAAAAFRLSASESNITAGEMVTVRLELLNNSVPVSGASFELHYPTNALRLIDSQSLHTGAIVPRSAAVLWNISPGQTDFLSQDGKVEIAISTANPWNAVNGIVAEFVFQIQPGAANELNWPIIVANGELASGSQVQPVSGTEFMLQGRAPVPLSFVKVGSGNVQLRFEGENGRTYRLEYSQDLNTWFPVTNGTVTVINGTATIADSSNSGEDYRFYRVLDRTQ